HGARQGIAERLAELGSTLPAGVGTPKLSPLVSSTMDLLKIGLLSDKVDAYTLRDAANWVIKPRLLAVPGVAHVIVFGGDQRQIQILPDIARLASYNVTISEVADAARTALPLRGAGFIDLASQRILIKSPTPAPDIAALSAAVVTVRNNTPILLRDLAEVKVAPALRFGDALIAFSAIPLSLLAAVAVLDRMGLTLNTMTLGGFAVALGVLVDDAIIGIENILRRLRGNARLDTPRPRLEIIREASLEVRGPVIYATAVVVAVFLPELFTTSVQGRFVGPLALAFIFAVLASLVVRLE